MTIEEWIEERKNTEFNFDAREDLDRTIAALEGVLERVEMMMEIVREDILEKSTNAVLTASASGIRGELASRLGLTEPDYKAQTWALAAKLIAISEIVKGNG